MLCHIDRVLQIEAERYRIFKTFMFIPAAIVKRICQDSTKKLEALTDFVDDRDDLNHQDDFDDGEV